MHVTGWFCAWDFKFELHLNENLLQFAKCFKVEMKMISIINIPTACSEHFIVIQPSVSIPFVISK